MGIRAMFHMSAAAGLVRALLEQMQRTGLFQIDPKDMSSKLVAKVFVQDEDRFNGKKGPRPHRLAVAAVALAQGMRDYEQDSDQYSACHLALGNVMVDMENNGHNYALTGVDHAFIKLALREYMGHEGLTIEGWPAD